ncbi:hypothetical protein O0L34_g3724 [Tuta absoluta]|nr:hypothetical protein O0L34_g3724 [Tuta absoluta]
MHAAPARYVSVSELYSADEVELLLDEIRELEPTSCRGEDVQDFEIAGSGLGGLGGGGGVAAAGGRSPCDTSLTERSWDSHAHYSRAPPPRPLHVAPLYCRLRHLATLHGAVAAVIVLCSIGVCACVWSLVGVRSWLLPLSGRVRLLLLGGVTSALLHGLLLFAHVSRLAALLPVAWRRVAALASAWSALTLLPGAALVAHAALAAHEYKYAPTHVFTLLLVAAGFGCVGACTAMVLVGICLRTCVAEHRRAALPSASASRASGVSGALAHAATAYRAVPRDDTDPPRPAPGPAPGPAPQPSTSRQNAL